MILTGERVAVGAFVVVWPPDKRILGIGKVVRVSGETITVTYCDVPGESEPYKIDVPVGDVRVVALSEQTRVFRFDEANGRWQVGRIIAGEGPECQLALPNQGTLTAPRSELLVRWRRPITNPVEFLIRQVTETPLFADARSNFMKAATRQYAACRGMTALLSSRIELEDYQFNVVTRVLEDPVQRYLLADEVGLGKTVEAGLVIRQYVLDSHDARVLVIAPPGLVDQWIRELSDRFGLLDRIDDTVWVVSSEDLQAVEEHLADAGMLVVDEAHHLSKVSSQGAHPLYAMLQPHAASVERLLLLSGTPVLADTPGFLRILNLLDPVVFPLTDLGGFETRLQSRQLVAEVAASLTPDNMLAMESDLDRLSEAFGDDSVLMRRVEKLRPIVQSLPGEDDPEFRAALSDLRAHLSETYKLHRRILRNRRKAVPWATPQRSGLEALRYTSPWRAERHRVLDELRVHLVNSEDLSIRAHNLFPCAVHPYGGVTVVATLEEAGVVDSRALELARQADDLAVRAENEADRMRVTCDAVRRCLGTPRVQVVIFCDAVTTADALTGAIVANIRGMTQVVRHSVGDESWREFLKNPSRFRVLVCDARAEEGLNLHGGHKVALHFDLPATPNRIEQRLGRLDRYGTGESVRSLAPACESDPNEFAWVSCLDEGLRVFSSSISSLQYVVEKTLRSAVDDWCNEGVTGLLRWKDRLSGPKGVVALEQRRIDQQDMLDAMGDSGSTGFKRLDNADGEWRTWRDAFLGFAEQTLRFKYRTAPWEGSLTEGERVFRLNYVRDRNHQTLLSVVEFRDHFAGAIDAESRDNTPRSIVTHPYAFDRRTVMSREGGARGLRMLRCGDPFVESMRAFCQNDDRGRVCAVWRFRPDHEARDSSGCDLWFRFDYLIKARVPSREYAFGRALSRRAEQHFPQQFYTVWVEASREVTLVPPANVTAPYRDAGSGRDYNLNPARWEKLHLEGGVPWLVEWRHHCESEAEKALQFITGHDALRQHIDKGRASLDRQHVARVAQLEARLTRLTGPALMEERRALDQEGRLHGDLVEAILSPEIQVDSVRAVFMSARTPFSS